VRNKGHNYPFFQWRKQTSIVITDIRIQTGLDYSLFNANVKDTNLRRPSIFHR